MTYSITCILHYNNKKCKLILQFYYIVNIYIKVGYPQGLTHFDFINYSSFFALEATIVSRIDFGTSS